MDIEGMDFWTRMSSMMDAKLDNQIDRLCLKLQDLETQMAQDLQGPRRASKKESAERKEAADVLRQDIERPADKVNQLENRMAVATPTPATTTTAGETWTADHIVVDGWNIDIAARTSP